MAEPNRQQIERTPHHMTEQQYRVIADRDKGDDPYTFTREPGDRVTYGDPAHIIVRIERPVPTTDEQKRGVSTDRLRGMADLLDGLLNRATLRQAADELDRLRADSPPLPTREQIAEALSMHRIAGVSGFGIESIACSCNRTWVPALEYREHLVDAVLALLQKEADRG